MPTSPARKMHIPITHQACSEVSNTCLHMSHWRDHRVRSPVPAFLKRTTIYDPTVDSHPPGLEPYRLEDAVTKSPFIGCTSLDSTSCASLTPTLERSQTSLPSYDQAVAEKSSEAYASAQTARPKLSLPSRRRLIIAAVVLMLLLIALTVSLVLDLTEYKALAASITGDPELPIRAGIQTNFPDPAIYYHNATETWYAYGGGDYTGIQNPTPEFQNPEALASAHANVQVARSSDFQNWELLPPIADPLPNAGAWAKTGLGSVEKDMVAPLPNARVWAPDVMQHPTNHNTFLMYYAARSATTGVHCLGAASASSPTGPFTPQATSLACPANNAGAIDAAGFVDPTDNAIYVVYKIDGNSLGHGGSCNNMAGTRVDTPIVLQRMLPDGLTPDPAFPATTILHRTDADGPLVEAPSLVKVGATYFLFFSSGCTNDKDYDVSYAWASNIAGPYTHSPKPLILTGDYNLLSPGSVSVAYAGITNDATPMDNIRAAQRSTTGWVIAMHARVETNEGDVRAMFTAGLTFEARSNGMWRVDVVDASVSKPSALPVDLAVIELPKIVTVAGDVVVEHDKRHVYSSRLRRRPSR